ncbi:MAG: MOSC domain-containing protein [Bacillota bacterium]
MQGKIIAVCQSQKKGTTKQEIKSGFLVKEHGLKNDAHAGNWHRQISLLDKTSINKMRAENYEIKNGDFAENITTAGMILYQLPIGTKLKIGKKIILEITQIGKKCHHDCEIAQQIGKCVMPKEGVFARVISGGEVKAGDKIRTINK